MDQRIPVLCLLLFFCAGYGCGQESPADLSTKSQLITQQLNKAKFLDAEAGLFADTLFIRFDRSPFRSGLHAVDKLMQHLDQVDLQDIQAVAIISAYRNIVGHTITLPVSDGILDRANGAYQIGQAPEIEQRLRQGKGRLANYHALFSLDPEIGFAFGANPDPIQVQFNLRPRLDLRLWPGSLVRLEGIIPVWNELEIPEEDFIRPGRLLFSQHLRLAKGLFSSLQVGYFSDYRYGGQIEVVKYLLQDHFYLGLQAGYTGYASFPRRLLTDEPSPGWEASPIRYFDYQLLAGWRWDRFDLTISGSWARGLFDQDIGTVQIQRQFDQTRIGFFAQQVNQEWNYGAAVLIPLPFARAFVGRRLTIQTGPFLPYRYNGTQTYAAQYQTDHRFPFFTDHTHPDLFLQ